MTFQNLREYIRLQRKNGTSWGDIYFELTKYILDCFYDIEQEELLDEISMS